MVRRLSSAVIHPLFDEVTRRGIFRSPAINDGKEVDVPDDISGRPSCTKYEKEQSVFDKRLVTDSYTGKRLELSA